MAATPTSNNLPPSGSNSGTNRTKHSAKFGGFSGISSRSGSTNVLSQSRLTGAKNSSAGLFRKKSRGFSGSKLGSSKNGTGGLASVNNSGSDLGAGAKQLRSAKTKPENAGKRS